MKFDYPIGATPLDPDEIAGLIPTHITAQAQLNEWEQVNIIKAETWLFTTKHSTILTTAFLQRLHKKMFDQTWRWAGKFRQTDKNIGINWMAIPIQLKDLLDDVRYQIAQKSYSLDEIATRFHHRLVLVHPFANGNGRHARLMTDILLTSNQHARFTWGRNNLSSKNETRERYIKSLRAADQYNYSELLEFVRL